jgi:hypothetical protein
LFYDVNKCPYSEKKCEDIGCPCPKYFAYEDVKNPEKLKEILQTEGFDLNLPGWKLMYQMQTKFASRFHNLENITKESIDTWVDKYLVCIDDELREVREWLSLYGENIKTEFIRRFTRFMTLANLYADDIHKYKFNSVNKFIATINTEKYYDRDHYKQPFEKVENIKKIDLERVLAKSYGLSKELNRRMRRIRIIREHQINGIIRNRKKRCCNCLYKCCIASFCKRIKCILFSLICLGVLAGEVLYFIRNKNSFIKVQNNVQSNEILSNYISVLENTSSTKTVSNIINNIPINFADDKNSTSTGPGMGAQIGYLVLLYPL